MFVIDHREDLNGRVSTVEIKGALNSETSPDLEDYINRLINKDKTFILLNAKNIEYVSSEGIGLVLYVHKKVAAHKGYFILFNLTEEIQTLYTLLGIDKVITIAHSLDEALSIMEKQIELTSSGHVSRRSARADIQASGKKHAPAEIKKGIDNNRMEIDFENPLIAECTSCKSLIRIKKSGNYLCPECHREFTVEKDQSVIF